VEEGIQREQVEARLDARLEVLLQTRDAMHKAAEGGGTYNPVTHQIDYVLDASNNPFDYAGGDPIANLTLVRSIFFPRPGFTLGSHNKHVFSQGQFCGRDRAAPRC